MPQGKVRIGHALHNGIRSNGAELVHIEINRGKGWVEIAVLRNVIHTYNGHIFRNPQSVLTGTADGADGHIIISTENGTGNVAAFQISFKRLVSASLKALLGDGTSNRFPIQR